MLAQASLRFLIPMVLLMAVATAAFAESPFSYEGTPGELPKTVCPLDYTIRLEPDLDKLTTHGTMTVEILVMKPVTEIVLNAVDLEITNVTLFAQRKMVLQPRIDGVKQTVTLPLPAPVAPGKYRLTLDFSGRIGGQAQGLFYVKYAAADGKKLMLGTQMEPADARRMFPCWDEPVFRATFELTVMVPQKHLAVSNMPIEHEKPLDGGMKEVKFARTPPMASYLVVLVSGELEELKGEAEGVPIRIITTEGKREEGRYALDTAKRVLAYYNDYFGISYPMPKLDLIAVPGGFGGAMENWGAITYNERNLLFDPAKSSQATRQGVFSIVAHEMAHQWFGDLVTMSWWDNLWLNEGFASWMAAKATGRLNPDWETGLNAGLTKTGVMSEDSRSSTHPILQAITNESQANDAFDHITYDKGQSFLRMLENFLGEKAFQRGIHQYLADHEFSNTTTADLWNALEDASGKPVKALAAGWTEQPGLPVVTVSTNCVNGRQVVTLTQERFTLLDPNAKPLQWIIPVALMDIAHPDTVAFALLDGKTTSVPFGDCDAIIKANAGDAGYYRVAYEPALFERLRRNIATLPDADRLGLLNDSWAMVEAGRVPASDYLDLADSLRDERNYTILNQIISVFDFMDTLERDLPGRAAFQDYARRFLRPQLKRLGWMPKAGEPPMDLLLRSRVIGMLGKLGDEAVIAETRARYKKFIARPGTLPADLRAPVLTIAGRYADRATYDQLHELARTAKGTEERQLYYRAMAGALDPELAKLTLALSLSDETVPQETAGFVSQVAQAGEQPELAWDFARSHIKELLGEIESFRRNGYVPGIMGAFSDAARADELEAYVKENLGPDARAKARETAEGIRLKADIKRRDLPVIDKWVEGRK